MTARAQAYHRPINARALIGHSLEVCSSTVDRCVFLSPLFHSVSAFSLLLDPPGSVLLSFLIFFDPEPATPVWPIASSERGSLIFPAYSTPDLSPPRRLPFVHSIMSVSRAPRASFQPFQCVVCQSRFTRHENLKRHAALHSRSARQSSLPCEYCQATFSRPDLRNRHMKRKHSEHVLPRLYPEEPWTPKPRRQETPRVCTEQRTETPPTPSLDSLWQEADLAHIIADMGKSPQPISENEWFPSAQQITRGRELFFAHVAHFVPFLHQPTFDTSHAPPHFLLGMMCLAYQHGDDPDEINVEDSGSILSLRCFDRTRALMELEGNDLFLLQSHLLLQICAMMYLCGNYSAVGLKIHTTMISLARAGGFMQPLPTSPGQDLESLWEEFIQVESHKRTMFAIHQIDALWYQFLSIPRSISHLEIKLELPCPEELWSAGSAAQWAHRQLVTRQAGSSMQYADAIRVFLSAEVNIPPFDPYGAINVAQFLISSAREISGWSTMTGMVSMERFAALRSSLLALRPFIQPLAGTGPAAALCEATWESAMMELQMWSPSHTGGIVEASIDAVLEKSSDLAPSSEFLCESNIAENVQPHVDWFLRYLDDTQETTPEAPWMILYAYKAFLMAWQLMRGGIAGAMQVVGVHDLQEAVIWAQKVFQRRRKRQLGKLILSCLRRLPE